MNAQSWSSYTLFLHRHYLAQSLLVTVHIKNVTVLHCWVH